MNTDAASQQSPQTFKLICRDYPSDFALDKTVCKAHFRKYGKVKRLTFKPRLRICVVEYTNEEDYLNALNNAEDYHGQQLNISEDKSPPNPTVNRTKIVQQHKISYIDNDEIQKELVAMGGIQPEVVDLTLPIERPKPETLPKLKRKWKVGIPKPIIKKKTEEIAKPQSFTAEQLDLIKLTKSQAITVEEKYRILDARDKLIRLITKKNVQLKSTPTVGTCLDMCPEKERLMRETQHQVALYEQDDNDRRVMNPNKAVKQYSRSSADQETPLPHELRPVSVLEMTMAYLMHNIMDLCDDPDVNLTEWFHFLWDRTRGIRKDITQQALCCQGSVELVEQCARFHIHCSARLVAEDPSVFDQKINTENLTKCLQTLKYMYHDLRLKGESCPNEAEFRAYIILLNLNDGNFMWEVQELREDIQKSIEIKFALRIYSAFEKKNYVKFFNLIKSTSYLNACILMRYFVQVRVSAVETLLKCFTPPKSFSFYPINELQGLLGFDDIESTIEFMQTYGLAVNKEKTHFVLSRRAFILPEYPYLLDRSLNFVENKKQSSVGKIVCGKDLSPEILMKLMTHETQNSFDLNGNLIFGDILKESDLKIDIPKTLETTTDSRDFVEEPKSLFPSQPENLNVFGQKRSKSIFAQKHSTVTSNVFLKKPTTETDVFASQKPQQSDPNIFATQKPQAFPSPNLQPTGTTNIFPQSPSIFAQKPQAKPTSIFGQPKEENFNIFKNDTSASIFGTKISHDESSSESIFAKNPPMDQLDSPSRIFAKAAQSIPPPSVFGQQKDPRSIFAKAYQDIAAPNAFGGPSEPKKGGFTFNLPVTPKEKDTGIFEVKNQDNMSVDNFETTPLINLQNETGKPFLPVFPSRVKKESQEDLERKKQEEMRRQKDIEELRNLEEEKKRIEMELQKEMEKEKLKQEEIRRKNEELKRKVEEEQRKKIEEEQRRKYEEAQRKIREEEERKRQEQERKRRDELKREKERLRNVEIAKTVKAVMETVVNKVDSKIREETLAKIRGSMQKRSLLNIFRKWRQIVAKNKRKRKAMDCSPVWFNTKNLQECANELHTDSQDLTLKYIKRYKYGKPLEIPIIEDLEIPKINIYNLTYNFLKHRLYNLKEKWLKNIFWKVVISLPDNEEKGISCMEKTLNSCINWTEHNVYIEQFKVNTFESVTYCIEKQKGFQVTHSDANAFIFIANDFNVGLQRRIYENLKDFRIFTKVPVVVISQENIDNEEYLESVKESGTISEYKILSNNLSPYNLIELIEYGLIFLSKNVEKSPPLELDNLYLFLNEYLCIEPWRKAASFAKWNSDYKNCMKSPDIVINLYNEGLRKLCRIVLNKDCHEYAMFPEIFRDYLPSKVPDFLPCNYRYFPKFWKNPRYTEQIKNIFTALELPQFCEKWPPENDSELRTSISKYCSEVFGNPEEAFLTIYNIFKESVEENSYKDLLWVEAIEVLALQKLKEQDLSLKGTEFEEGTIYTSFIVVYKTDTLENYVTSDWFYRNNSMIEKHKKIFLKQEKPCRKRDISKANLNLEDFNEVILKAEKVLKAKTDKRIVTRTQEVVENLNKSIEDLETSISIVKRMDEMDLLKRIVDE